MDEVLRGLPQSLEVNFVDLSNSTDNLYDRLEFIKLFYMSKGLISEERPNIEDTVSTESLDDGCYSSTCVLSFRLSYLFYISSLSRSEQWCHHYNATTMLPLKSIIILVLARVLATIDGDWIDE